jgi:hypothetical protein
VQRPVERDVVEIQSDDPIERAERLVLELLEHPRVDPLVAPGPQRRVRHPMLEDRLDIDPRRAGHQPDHDPAETQPVRSPRAMTPQRMVIDCGRQQRLERRPENLHHFGFQRAHDDGCLHSVVVGWVHPQSNAGQPDDRWMAT